VSIRPTLTPLLRGGTKNQGDFKMKLSNITAELLLKKEELEAQIEELELKNIILEPLYARYRDTYLNGVAKEEKIRIEVNKLKRHFGKPTLSLEDVSIYMGIDVLQMEMLFIDQALPFKFVYLPSSNNGADVFFVPIEFFAEYLVDHTVN
jgi:hypothetical protein